MPIYEYRCPDCEAVTSALRRIGERDEALACEMCGKPSARVVSSFSAHLSLTSKVEKADPKYDKMVDNSFAFTEFFSISLMSEKVRLSRKTRRPKKS